MAKKKESPPQKPVACGRCSNGQRMVTVNQCGADGTPYKAVRMERCDCQNSR
ncbi:hypothetical protein [Streptomyces sp. NPDC056987]|uniref:hypothetical protein n=1 Tax=Streptomyces sp. NPDC056987 TaxID=3345988 RepID=UPI003640DEEE